MDTGEFILGSGETTNLQKQQQKMHSSSKGGGRQMLRHIDGDVPMCLGKKRKHDKREAERSEQLRSVEADQRPR